MLNKVFIASYKTIIAVVVLYAVITQLNFGIASIQDFRVSNFFSFFTIESNILAALVFLISAGLTLAGKRSHALDILRGAATLYMVTTGIVYALLLSGLEESLQTPIPWVNFVLHYAFPVIALADWLIDRPAFKVTLQQGLIWLIFPVIYAVYSLVRGANIGWYPYPFLNPLTEGGYGKVAIVSVMIAIGAYALTIALTQVPAKKR